MSDSAPAQRAGIDWEDAFANAGRIPGGARYPDLWAKRAAAFRASHEGELDVAYGEGPRERFDLFLPQGAPKGLVAFLHGGYWLAFDKSSWSDLAAGPLALGWAVALPSYALAPEAAIPEIAAQAGRAVAAAAGKVAGPIRLAGHSAGGHLAARMACEGGPLPESAASRLERVVSISGLHDLRPLLLHSMNEKLRLSEASAASESAALLPPSAGVGAVAWVGAGERPEFLRQSALLAEAWSIPLVAEPGRHHFDVIDGLRDSGHPLCQAVAGG